MPNYPNVRVCTHIKVTGVRCGSPALRGEQFCYFHQRMLRSVRTPPQARLHPIALLEDEESIQASLMEVVNALMRNTIDLKRATLILRALNIAVKNARRVRFNHTTDMVQAVPEYATPAPVESTVPESEFDLPYETGMEPLSEQEINRRKQRVAEVFAEQDRKAAIRAALVRSAQGIASGPSLPDPTHRKPPENAKEVAKSVHAGTGTLSKTP